MARAIIVFRREQFGVKYLGKVKRVDAWNGIRFISQSLKGKEMISEEDHYTFEEATAAAIENCAACMLFEASHNRRFGKQDT